MPGLDNPLHAGPIGFLDLTILELPRDLARGTWVGGKDHGTGGAAVLPMGHSQIGDLGHVNCWVLTDGRAVGKPRLQAPLQAVKRRRCLRGQPGGFANHQAAMGLEQDVNPRDVLISKFARRHHLRPGQRVVPRTALDIHASASDRLGRCSRIVRWPDPVRGVGQTESATHPTRPGCWQGAP